ncbi:hypothetical protein UFOVP1290_614 [uncultured Caudovirales phage]|uniref:Uncharacterized protein n=1 Tax=uncultured Caudovirales phage TaxID=2100421 RepID=A0A6J5RYA9_9CAUD|nr:hypothetical protein UFOVP1290_614 [uncultured Caudovirales phage]
MYKSAQNARQTGRGFFNKLREGLDFSGMAQEKLFNPEFQDIMNKLRDDTDDPIRSIITGEQIGTSSLSTDGKSLKNILADAKSNINKLEYMMAISSLALFHEKMSDVVKILKSFTYNVDKVHEKFLFGGLDEENKKRLQSLKTRFAKSEYDLVKSAKMQFNSDILDFLTTYTTEKGRALRSWEKKHPKEIGKIRDATSALLKSSEQLLSRTLPLLKEMASARATRNPDKYVECTTRFIKFYDSYNDTFKKYYVDNIKRFEPVLHKIEQITESSASPQASASVSRLSDADRERIGAGLTLDSSVVGQEQPKTLQQQLDAAKQQHIAAITAFRANPSDDKLKQNAETATQLVQSLEAQIAASRTETVPTAPASTAPEAPATAEVVPAAAGSAEVLESLQEELNNAIRAAKAANEADGSRMVGSAANRRAISLNKIVAELRKKLKEAEAGVAATKTAELKEFLGEPEVQSRRGILVAPPVEIGSILPPSRRTQSHANFYNSLQKMASESPVILALYINKYAKSIKESDPKTAIKLFKIASSIEV